MINKFTKNIIFGFNLLLNSNILRNEKKFLIAEILNNMKYYKKIN